VARWWVIHGPRSGKRSGGSFEWITGGAPGCSAGPGGVATGPGNARQLIRGIN